MKYRSDLLSFIHSPGKEKQYEREDGSGQDDLHLGVQPGRGGGAGGGPAHISSQSLLSPHHPSPGVLVLGLVRLPRHQPAGALALAAHGLLGQEAPAEARRSHGGCQLGLGSAHLRIFTSRLSSHRQVMPSSYGAHRWTMAAWPPGSDD